MTDRNDLRARAEADAARLQALKRLAARRREALTDADYHAYLDGLQDLDAELVYAVCETLGREEPGEFQPRFPMLGTIRARCEAILAAKRLQAREDEQRRYFEACRRAPRVSPERGAEIMAEITAKLNAIKRKSRMPS